MHVHTNYGNRGMAFEELINYSNQLYEQKNIAIINKRPTPVKVLGRSAGRVTGFFEKPSTVDYDGVYKSRSIVFESKSTRDLHKFDLKNIEPHQVEYLEKCESHGAISFVLVELAKLRKVYLMHNQTLKHYWNIAQKGGRKSIPLDAFEVNAWEVGSGRVPLDYLLVVDKVWKVGVA